MPRMRRALDRRPRKLFSGQYNRAEAGTGDKRVWTETGCTRVLITSTQDSLG